MLFSVLVFHFKFKAVIQILVKLLLQKVAREVGQFLQVFRVGKFLKPGRIISCPVAVSSRFMLAKPRIMRKDNMRQDKFMESEYNFNQGKRGAIEPTPPGKTRITIRLDDEILT